MEVADIGGAWILETPDAEVCAVDIPPVTPSLDITTLPWAYIAGAAIIGAIVGYAVKGRK